MQDNQVPVRGGEIKLGQFLKLANLVETGGEAKEVIAQGEVTVNGETDTRRGRRLVAGDQVRVGGMTAAVADAAATGEDDYFDEATADDDFDPEKWRNL
ncbi:hypothetical protein CATYP_00355 [Corynebacterium atypicum]|uniref:RNA-binding protein S4 n=1 Tax=Corynebacterium atypicum TaxID=191610 RepID=A0ABM5QKW7_9CORY|nr:RNA-binding S4 domain-containing protein [Corynebacterium atypicum]AIG63411.1 hypothetical protein CATYP_00355 [Corynebacterium atypicum]